MTLWFRCFCSTPLLAPCLFNVSIEQVSLENYLWSGNVKVAFNSINRLRQHFNIAPNLEILPVGIIRFFFDTFQVIL